MLFQARARLSVPGDASLDSVRENLERIADDLMVDLSLDDWK
jgi:glycine cleavage system regulatory protein